MQIYDSKVLQTKLSAAEQQANTITKALRQLQKQLISAKKENQKTNTQHFGHGNNHRNDL